MGFYFVKLFSSITIISYFDIQIVPNLAKENSFKLAMTFWHVFIIF